MSIKLVIQVGDPRLKAPNQSITDFNSTEFVECIESLKDAMHQTGLVGIAAPQLGINLQVFLTEPRETPTRPKEQSDILRIYVNPKIIPTPSTKVIIFEGCGSVANGQLFGPVLREKEVTVEAYDENGKKFRLTCDGILARVIQHEYDHLQGKEFLAKIADFQEVMDLPHYQEFKKTDASLLENSTIKKIECKKL